MNTQANAMPDSVGSVHVARDLLRPTRPFYWSVRRELMENRSVYFAPLLVSAVFLLGFVFTMQHHVREAAMNSADYRAAIVLPYDVSAGMMMLLVILVSVFYSMDALHGERKDRSILFWKSLPVSDLTTILAKATIPIVAIPLIATAVTICLQFVMLILSSIVLLATGQSVTRFWSELSPLQMWILLLYHIMTAHALWPAPIYAWLMFVSGWARRAVLLWAALPVLAIAGLEAILFRTSHFASLLGARLIGDSSPVPSGAKAVGISVFPTNPLMHIRPFDLLLSWGFWGGVLVTVIFLAAAVRMRRYRGPV